MLRIFITVLKRINKTTTYNDLNIKPHKLLSSKLFFRQIDIDKSDNTVFFYIILLTIFNNKSNRMATISILYLTMISIGHKNLLIFLHYVMTYTLVTFQLIITAINLYDIIAQ